MEPLKPPDYLFGKISAPDWSGPSGLLKDGSWCGHGESKFHVFDVGITVNETFQVFLPCEDAETGVNLPVVQVVSSVDASASFLVYDSRKHPSSIFAMGSYDNQEPCFDGQLLCPHCNRHRFRLSVGFEVPVDSMNDNDTTWFTLAATCTNCGSNGIIYEDETC
jgi:hypothetical protein